MPMGWRSARLPTCPPDGLPGDPRAQSFIHRRHLHIGGPLTTRGAPIDLDLFKERGTRLDQQHLDWQDLSPMPISKLDDDAFTRVRIILMNGIEQQRGRLMHHLAQFHGPLRVPLAQVRRVSHHQQTMVNWLLPPDQTPLDTTIAYAQVAIEVTAMIAQAEPDPDHAQIHRVGLLEDFNHLYRFSALLDRTEGKDANNILQSYTDVAPGRPTVIEHRAPVDDVRRPYDRQTA